MAITKFAKLLGYLGFYCFTACASRDIAPERDGPSRVHDSARHSIETLPLLTEADPSFPMPTAQPMGNESAAPHTNGTSAVMVPDKPTEPFAVRNEHGRAIQVYPPTMKVPRAPFVVVLHATCMQPAWVCDWFGNAGRDTGWLVCPSGNSTCAGEPDWHGPGPEKAVFLDHALKDVAATIPTFIDEQPGVLIGWSRGAFAARDILYAALDDPQLLPLAKRFRGLVLLAAQVKPDVAKLQRVGITRVVMAAGDYDGAKSTMVAAVATLQAGGIAARYVSLGKIAHRWPDDFETRMREPIAWAGHAHDH